MKRSATGVIPHAVAATALMLVAWRGSSAQSVPTPEQRALAGTWYLVTTPPSYDTRCVPRRLAHPPDAATRATRQVRFVEARSRFRHAPPAYPRWVEMNPRD